MNPSTVVYQRRGEVWVATLYIRMQESLHMNEHLNESPDQCIKEQGARWSAEQTKQGQKSGRETGCV